MASENEEYLLVMRVDGNLVLSFNNQNRILWESQTSGVGRRVVMERDGDLVIYNRRNEKIWRANITPQGRGEYAQLENDGNLVVYDSSGLGFWSTNRSISKLKDNLF